MNGAASESPSVHKDENKTQRRRAWSLRLLAAGVALLLVLLVVGLLLPALGLLKRSSSKLRPAANLRGAYASMIAFGNSNNGFLPGLDPSGNILAPGAHATGSDEFSGAAASSRYWLLLNGKYIGADLAINPNEFPSQGRAVNGVVNGKVRWSPGQAVTTANFSYALLGLADSPDSTSARGNAGRIAEWKVSANSKAIMISDRNTGISNIDASVRSAWSDSPGCWVGNILRGDCSAEMVQTNLGFKTRYNGVYNVGDNLFATAQAAGVTEGGKAGDANAMMVHN